MAYEIHPEEQKLVRLSLKGDRKAQFGLYQRYVQAMYHTAIRMVPEPMDAEDIVQDSFVKVFRHLDSFKWESTLGAWIKRITVNTALNYIRRKNRAALLELEHPGNLPDITAEDTNPEVPHVEIAVIHEAIKKLPEGCRIVFSLHLLEGYRHREIAELLDISESTSKSQYLRARRLLQEHLKNQVIHNL